MVQHRRQRRQKITDDCPRFFALKALGDNLIDLRLINLIDAGLSEVFYKTRRIFVPAGDSITLHAFGLATFEIRISGDFWTRVWSSIFRPRFDRRLPYGADEAGAQATAQSERIRPWLVANR